MVDYDNYDQLEKDYYEMYKGMVRLYNDSMDCNEEPLPEGTDLDEINKHVNRMTEKLEKENAKR